MKKMGKRFLAGTAFAMTALTVAGCGQGPAEALYGPPPMETEVPAPGSGNVEAPGSGNTEAQTTAPETGAFDPSGEVEPDLYGPPPTEE